MMHNKRLYGIDCVQTPENLAEKLCRHNWVLCSGFLLEWAGRTLLYLNDSISEDSLQEYAVLLPTGEDGVFDQVESLTVSWMDSAEAASLFRKLHSATIKDDDILTKVKVKTEPAKEHARCYFCG